MVIGLSIKLSPAQQRRRLQTSGFRLQASDFRLQTSGFRLQASDFRLQTSETARALRQEPEA
jgi:hypothetical protein